MPTCKILLLLKLVRVCLKYDQAKRILPPFEIIKERKKDDLSPTAKEDVISSPTWMNDYFDLHIVDSFLLLFSPHFPLFHDVMFILPLPFHFDSSLRRCGALVRHLSWRATKDMCARERFN